jgi:ABC-2 type transport system permease protein
VSELIATYLDVYRAQFKATIAMQLQYRASLVLWLVWTLMEPIVYLTVWGTVARSSGGQLGGFTPGDFAAYYLLAMWVGHLTFTWLMWEFEFRVREGQFSPKLLRPIHPIHADIADNVTYKVLTLVVLVPATAVLIWLFGPTAHTTPRDALLFVPALLMAFFLRFLTGWTLALAAFWTTRVNAINNLFFTIQVFMGGFAVPIGLLPAWAQALTWTLPFRWMVSFPVELGLGRLGPAQIAIGFVMQAIWAVVVFAMMQFVWRAALQRYTAVGA